MGERPIRDRDYGIAFLDACGLLYLPILLASICIPQDTLEWSLRGIASAFPLAGLITALVMSAVMVCCANGFFQRDVRRKQLFRAGLGLGMFAFIYLAGNSLDLRGGIWYFVHLNMLLMLILTYEIDVSGHSRSDGDKIMYYIVRLGHRFIGAMFLVSFMVASTPIWVAFDYLTGTYFALCSWKCISRSRALALAV